MNKAEDRLDRIEGTLGRLGIHEGKRASDLSPEERRARIRELVSKEIGLDHVMTQAQYEAWLVKTYPADAAPPLPLPSTETENPEDLSAKERRELIEAHRAREAWKIRQRCKEHNPKRGPRVYNGPAA